LPEAFCGFLAEPAKASFFTFLKPQQLVYDYRLIKSGSSLTGKLI
jgi:hypothetical protein